MSRSSIHRTASIDAGSGGTGNIKVCVRVRPFSRREIEQSETTCVSMPTRTDVCVDGKASRSPGQKIYSFDRAYNSFDPRSSDCATQETLMEELGSELLRNVLEGYNVCLCAYGQTGSGKTFSVLGSKTPPELRGLLPRLLDGLFQKIEEEKAVPVNPTTFTMSVSYMEIYNEQLRDLLKLPGHAEVKLQIHHNSTIGVYVAGLTDNPVFTREDVQKMLEFGMKSRHMGSTLMNEQSSRSHCIFSLELKQVKTNSNGQKTNLRCRVNLVDLAGSERQKKSEAEGARLKEGAMINQSLTNLAMVIYKLAQIGEKKTVTSLSKAKDDFVPFRNSKLTHCLQDSLSGNSKTVLIAAISPASSNYEETVSTLRFAESVKSVKTKARKNEELEGNLLNNLKEEMRRLKEQMAAGNGGEEEFRRSKTLVEKYGANYEDQLNSAREHAEYRQAALADMGLALGEINEIAGLDRGCPQLVDISGDIWFETGLVYFLQPGEPITIGSSEESKLVLKGKGIMPTTATITHEDNLNLYIRGGDGRLLVNGVPLGGKQQLRHGDRINMGYDYFWRVMIPGAIDDIDYTIWERQSLLEYLDEFLPEEEEQHSQCHWLVGQLEAKLGGTRTHAFLQQLRKAVELVDEANSITHDIRPRDRYEFRVEIVEQVFTDFSEQPECVIRLRKGETGKTRWRNVTQRHILAQKGLEDITASLSVSPSAFSRVGGAPSAFSNIMLCSLPAFRERLKAMRKIHETFESQGVIDFSADDPWKENMGKAAPTARNQTAAANLTGQREPPYNSSEWLTMEARVRAHAMRITELERSERKQAERIKELEAQLALAKTSRATLTGNAPTASPHSNSNGHTNDCASGGSSILPVGAPPMVNLSHRTSSSPAPVTVGPIVRSSSAARSQSPARSPAPAPRIICTTPAMPRPSSPMPCGHPVLIQAAPVGTAGARSPAPSTALSAGPPRLVSTHGSTSPVTPAPIRLASSAGIGVSSMRAPVGTIRDELPSSNVAMQLLLNLQDIKRDLKNQANVVDKLRGSAGAS